MWISTVQHIMHGCVGHMMWYAKILGKLVIYCKIKELDESKMYVDYVVMEHEFENLIGVPLTSMLRILILLVALSVADIP